MISLASFVDSAFSSIMSCRLSASVSPSTVSRHAIAGTACGTAGEAEGRSAAMKGSQLQWGPMLLGMTPGARRS